MLNLPILMRQDPWSGPWLPQYSIAYRYCQSWVASKKIRNRLTSPSKVYSILAPWDSEKASELLYNFQAGSACVQIVHCVVFGKYCIAGSRSSIITDTRFDEDISTGIRGRGEEGQVRQRHALKNRARQVRLLGRSKHTPDYMFHHVPLRI